MKKLQLLEGCDGTAPLHSSPASLANLSTSPKDITPLEHTARCILPQTMHQNFLIPSSIRSKADHMDPEQKHWAIERVILACLSARRYSGESP